MLEKTFKQLSNLIPAQVGTTLNVIPFSVRLGKSYGKNIDLANKLATGTYEVKENYIINNFNSIFKNFYETNKFYREFIEERICTVKEIVSIEDIEKVPLVNKAILKTTDLNNRSNSNYASQKFNTGGTSGSPLSFYVEKNFYAREWAHMHLIWRRIGYNPSKTKLTIRGKSFSGIYKYNFNQNEFLINTYHDFTEADYIKLCQVIKKYNVEFIHGYPSAIFSFLKKAEEKSSIFLDLLKRSIKGVLLSSEFPSPHYRKYIEEVLTDNTVSWYGHSEAVILAGELNQKYEYTPFLSYGYTEAVEIEGHYHLVGTSFSNLATPFVRYDTEDLIAPNFDANGLLKSFEIKEGRIGQFLLDKNNNMISVTGLLFGRHHLIFNFVDFLQIKQLAVGKVIIYFTAKSKINNPENLFDSSNLTLDISFEQIEAPFKTALGKVPLIILK